MAFCPNCGTENNGGKFCCNCGAPLPISQPEQPAVQPAAQPVQQTVVQPVQQPAAQPVMEPVVQPAPQPVMEPVMEPVVEPVYQQSVQNVYSQAVAPAANEPKTNGMCKTGFILSIVGIFCLGLTSIFGLIFSIIGIVSSSKKKEKGRGLGIAGAIISAFILFVVIFNLAYLQSEFSDLFEEITGVSSGVVTAHTTDDDDDDKSNEYVEFIESDNWIETHEDSYLVFERKNSFKYYQTYEDTTNNYFTGKYELYTGQKAVEVITEDYEEAGLTKDEIEDILDKWDVDQEYFVCLVLNNDGCWVDGENTQDEKWTTVYVGVLQEEPDVELYLLNVSSATEYLFVPEDDFDFPAVTTTTATEETTAATTSETTQPTSATSDYSGYEAVGDSVSGYVYLTQGNWEVWTDASITSSDYDALYSRINTDTMTIFNLAVYSGQYQSASLGAMADSLKSGMESDTGYTNISVEETTVCGYKAYSVRGLYQDGMWLNVWIFVDNNGKLHYNSIEYFENDVASYNMFVETYTI